MGPTRAKRLELRLEKTLWSLRLMAILPVVMSLISTAVCFVLGTVEILKALHLLIDQHGSRDKFVALLLGELVSGIDLYLIGLALLKIGRAHV